MPNVSGEVRVACNPVSSNTSLNPVNKRRNKKRSAQGQDRGRIRISGKSDR